MVISIGKNISKHLALNALENPFDNVHQFAEDALKTGSKRVVQKTVETTGDLNGNEMAHENIAAASGSASETVSSKTKDIEFNNENSIEHIIKPTNY